MKKAFFVLRVVRDGDVASDLHGAHMSPLCALSNIVVATELVNREPIVATLSGLPRAELLFPSGFMFIDHCICRSAAFNDRPYHARNKVRRRVHTWRSESADHA